jgi:hypothetical protein
LPARRAEVLANSRVHLIFIQDAVKSNVTGSSLNSDILVSLLLTFARTAASNRLTRFCLTTPFGGYVLSNTAPPQIEDHNLLTH